MTQMSADRFYAGFGFACLFPRVSDAFAVAAQHLNLCRMRVIA